MYLNRWVRDRICESGLNYLEELAEVLLPGGVGIKQIRIAEQNHPRDVKACFAEFFNQWNEQAVATWQKLIDALKYTNRHRLASDIENALLPYELDHQGNYMHMYIPLILILIEQIFGHGCRQ